MTTGRPNEFSYCLICENSYFLAELLQRKAKYATDEERNNSCAHFYIKRKVIIAGGAPLKLRNLRAFSMHATFYSFPNLLQSLSLQAPNNYVERNIVSTVSQKG